VRVWCVSCSVRKVGSTHVEVFVCLLQRVVRIVSVSARVAVDVFVFAGGVEGGGVTCACCSG
jgi:hypothetical protein